MHWILVELFVPITSLTVGYCRCCSSICISSGPASLPHLLHSGGLCHWPQHHPSEARQPLLQVPQLVNDVGEQQLTHYPHTISSCFQTTVLVDVGSSLYWTQHPNVQWAKVIHCHHSQVCLWPHAAVYQVSMFSSIQRCAVLNVLNLCKQNGCLCISK